jgi:hypothetical protein
MTSRTRSDLQIESYLGRVRTALRGLTEREIDDILRELQSHVVELTDEAGGNAEAALQSLGDPLDLAKTYRSENQLTRAECSNSPLVILQGLRHASTSRWGRVLATALYLFGYANVVTLWAAAIYKLSSPSRAGIWYTPGNVWSLVLVTSGNPPAGSRELMGWWLVPAAVVAGWIVRYLVDRIAQRWIRRYRLATAATEEGNK